MQALRPRAGREGVDSKRYVPLAVAVMRLAVVATVAADDRLSGLVHSRVWHAKTQLGPNYQPSAAYLGVVGVVVPT